MKDINKKIHQFGNFLVESFHYLALFGIGSTIVWSASFDFLEMVKAGHATLEDILLLFIYLELGAMVGIYFRTHRLPVQFLIYTVYGQKYLTTFIIINLHSVCYRMSKVHFLA